MPAMSYSGAGPSGHAAFTFPNEYYIVGEFAAESPGIPIVLTPSGWPEGAYIPNPPTILANQVEIWVNGPPDSAEGVLHYQGPAGTAPGGIYTGMFNVLLQIYSQGGQINVWGGANNGWVIGGTVTVAAVAPPPEPIVIQPPPETPADPPIIAEGQARCVIENRNPALTLRWTRIRRFPSALSIYQFGRVAELTVPRLGMTSRKHVLTGIRHEIEDGSPPRGFNHVVEYTFEKRPMTNAAGVDLYLTFDVDGAGFDLGLFA